MILERSSAPGFLVSGCMPELYLGKLKPRIDNALLSVDELYAVNLDVEKQSWIDLSTLLKA